MENNTRVSMKSVMSSMTDTMVTDSVVERPTPRVPPDEVNPFQQPMSEIRSANTAGLTNPMRIVPNVRLRDTWLQYRVSEV